MKKLITLALIAAPLAAHAADDPFWLYFYVPLLRFFGL